MAKAKKLPSGSWRCQVYDYTDADGKRHYKSFTSNTRKEAEYQAAEYALNKKDKPKLPEYTLKTAIENYCNLKSNVLSPATIREYRRMKDNYYGEFGNTQLKDNDSGIVQAWVNDFAANHSPKTVKNAYGLISATIDAFSPDLCVSGLLFRRKYRIICMCHPMMISRRFCPILVNTIKIWSLLFIWPHLVRCADLKYVR